MSFSPNLPPGVGVLLSKVTEICLRLFFDRSQTVNSTRGILLVSSFLWVPVRLVTSSFSPSACPILPTVICPQRHPGRSHRSTSLPLPQLTGSKQLCHSTTRGMAGVRPTSVEMLALLFTGCVPRSSCLSSLSLCFFICEMGGIAHLTLRAVVLMVKGDTKC